MSVQIRGSSSAANVAAIGADGNLQAVSLGPDIGSLGGRYRHLHQTGAITAIAAVTGSAGHLWTFRNASVESGRLCLIEKISARYVITVGATVAQETGLSLWRTTAHTVDPTSGTAATLTTPQTKLRVSHPVPQATIYGENTTGSLTAGTYTMDTVPLACETVWQLASGATVPIPQVVMDVDFTDSPLVLAADEGLIVANHILQANSLAAKLRVMVQWREVSSYGQ